MEFRYRAVDERRSRSPPPPAAPSTPGTGSADGHGSDGSAERVGNSAVTLWQPDLAPPETTAVVDADELRRQAEKARIRERILREELAEHLELELEVRSELRDQMLHLPWPALGRPARRSGTPPAVSPGTITAANSSLLTVVALEAHPKASALATAPIKRKSPDHAAKASTVPLAPSSKKQKCTLTCKVCDITANSDKAMQDHLNGKVHKRKVVALPELPMPMPYETEQERGHKAGEEEAMAMEILGDYKPMKFMMAMPAGVLNEVTQMDGYLLCELCNVRTTDRITMMCHLQGNKHISNKQKKSQPSNKPSGTPIASADANKKLVSEDYSVPLPHTVRRLEGFLVCELCDLKVTSMNGMRQHLAGKKHKNKANTNSSDASVNVSSRGKEAAKAQPIDTDHSSAVISDNMAAKVEAPKKSLQPNLGDDSELPEKTVASPKEDVATENNNKTPKMKMMKRSETSAGPQLNNVCDSDSWTMEVDNMMHHLLRVDGLLVCPSCNAKAPSEITMQSHLAGKKHKRKMTLAAARGNNDLSILALGADDNSSKSTKGNVDAESAALEAKTVANEEAESTPSLTLSQTKNTPAMPSMAVDRLVEAQLASCTIEPVEEGEITEEAEEKHAVAKSNGSVTQAKESVITNDTTAPVKPFKIQVEGKVFTVAQQENGRLSCELCGVHGCDKDSMIMHLYTSTHWGKASLAEEKELEQACMAAASCNDG